MDRRVTTAGRGLASLVALLGLLVGPPLALIRFVGNPLPRSIPALDQVTEALTRQGISDEAVIDVLAILAWLVWTQVALAVVIEIAAQIRALPAPALPVLPGLQPIAGQLVAAVALLASLTGPRHPAGADAGLTLAMEPIVLVEQEGAPADAPSAESALSARATVPTTSYVVQRHDSLWSIAEEFLGDGMRWREIRDLNVGVRQPDGDSLTSSSDVIRSGWKLQVPGAHGTPAPSVGPATHVVQPGEHLWQVAEDHLEVAMQRDATDAEIDPYWRSVIEENRDALVDSDDPSLIFAGQVLDLPVTPGSEIEIAEEPLPPEPSVDQAPPDPAIVPHPPAADDPEPTRPTTTAPVTHTDPVSDAASDDVLEADEEDNSPVPGLLGVAGTGLAAAVAVQLLRRRRDHQARAPIGAVVPETPDELIDAHREIVSRADLDDVADVVTAMHELARHAASTSSSGSRPRIVQVGAEHIDVLVDVPDTGVPDGWQSEASGQVWTRSRPVEPTSASATPAPLLVSIGRPERGVELRYDLESAGLTIVSGQADPVDDLVRSVLLELVHGAPEVEVVLVGEVPAVEHDRVRTSAAWEDVADDVLSWATLSEESVRSRKLRSAFAARGTDQPLDGVVPLVVVMRDLPSDDRFEQFVDWCGRGAAVAAFVLSDEPVSTGTNLLVSDDGASIPSVGLDFEPQGVSSEVGETVECLVEASDQPAAADDAVSMDVELPADPAMDGVVSSNGHRYTDPDFDVLVRVLGQIDVAGGHRPLKPKQLAVLTFVATHPGCSAEQLEEALWPEPIETSRHRLHIALSQVRSALGADQLPNFDEASGYRVATTVRTDLDLFEHRVACAEGRSPAEAIEILRGALDLVTGPPFTYRSRGRQSFTWIDTEHWMSKTEAAIVKAAWTMWQLCSEIGDCDGAVWAAHQGLSASPTNTELTNCLMRAHVARGDRSAAETVYRSHLRALDQLDLGDPEESTVDLWQSEVRDQCPRI